MSEQSTSVFEMQRHLHDLEEQAKRLRSDVERLEATKTLLGASDTIADRASSVRRQIEAESASTSRRRGGRARQQPKKLPLPDDFIEELSRKAGEVNTNIAKHRELTVEKDTLLAALDKAAAKVDEVEQEYVTLSEIAGADGDSNSTAAVGLKKRNAYTYALNELVACYRKREQARVQMDAQSAHLQRIAAMAQETSNATEQKEQALAVLAEKEATLSAIRLENRKLEQVIRGKDDILIKKPRGLSEEEQIRSANYARRVILHELGKEHSQIKLNDQAIRYRAMEVAKVEKRLELIGDAVAGDGLSEEERVDVELVDTLISEIDALHNLQTEASIRVEYLDAEVERMEYKTSAMQCTIDGTRKELERVKKAHDRYLASLMKNVKAEQNAHDRDVAVLERQLDVIRSDMSSQRSAGIHRSPHSLKEETVGSA